MEGVDELCQDANKFNNYLRNVARQQQQKVAFFFFFPRFPTIGYGNLCVI